MSRELRLTTALFAAGALVLLRCSAPAPRIDEQPGLSTDGGYVCPPGTSVDCACTSGEGGLQTCLATGHFGPCSCNDACIPGRTESCFCGNGARGARRCLDSAEFDDCTCSGEPPPDAGSANTDAGAPDAGPPDAGTGHPDAGTPDAGSPDAGSSTGSTGVVFHAGADNLINLYPTSRGSILVRSTGIDLIAPDGTTLVTVPSPREITAAAFDGTLLGVADRAMVNVYDADLAPLRSINLVQTCASAVMVSGARFVCGPSNDWDRVFSIYDLEAGTLVGSSSRYTYQGIPMRNVPGTDDFVTVTVGTSPADYYLYRVNADNTISSFGDSPYHGAFTVTEAYAFDGTPAAHVVSPSGILLKIYTSTCSPTTRGCFQRDGELGTLAGTESFVAMADDGAGTVYGVVNGAGWSFDGTCATGCTVERVDVAARTIRSTATLTAKIGKFIAAKYDPYRQQFVVGYQVSSGSYGTPASGFTIKTFTLP